MRSNLIIISYPARCTVSPTVKDEIIHLIDKMIQQNVKEKVGSMLKITNFRKSKSKLINDCKLLDSLLGESQFDKNQNF